MEKLKLIEKRKSKGLSQSEIADRLYMDTSNYCRRESGQMKIAYFEWEKLADILEVPVGDIYEPEDNQVFICMDNTTVHNQGTNNICSIPEYLLEMQRKYVEILEKKNQILEKENQELRQKLDKQK